MFIVLARLRFRSHRAVVNRSPDVPTTPAGWSPPAGPTAPNDARRAVFLIAAGFVLVVGVGVGLLVVDWRASAQQDRELQELIEAGGGSNSLDAAGAPASLWVDADASGATVLVDGDSVGATPLWLDEVRSGQRRIQVLGPNETATDTTVWLEAGAMTELTVSLRASGPASGDASTPLAISEEAPPPAPRPAETAEAPAPAPAPVQRPQDGTLRVASSPAGATVTVNGRSVGTTPLVLRGIATGRHSVAVALQGYDTVDESVEVRGGAQSEAVFSLTAQTGGLEVLVRPWGTVSIDGQVRQRETDVVYRTQLPVGTHSVQVSHPTLGTTSREVVVRRNAVARLVFDLETNTTQSDVIGGGGQP